MEVLLKLTLFLIRSIFGPILTLCLKLHYWKIDKKYPLPPITDSILLLPAHVLAAKIRNRGFTSTQVVKAYIERINQIQPLINCAVETCFDDALKQAKAVDEILAEDRIPEKYSVENAPLLGVPFSCKECFWVKGMPNATGLVSRKDFRAPEDAEIVQNMRRAGAILTCVTNTSELCSWIESRNHLYGVSRNPYNLSRHVGGSSGGEGGLNAAAGSIIGIGSDIGGSIRIPSCLNGVYGHKPSFGITNNKSHYPPIIGEHSEKMLSSGPICRYASDLRLALKVQAGPLYEEFSDSFESDVDLSKLNFYVIEELEDCVYASKLSPECRDALKKAVHFVEQEFNVEVKKIDSRRLKDSFDMFNALSNNGHAIFTSMDKLLMDGKPGQFSPYKELFKSIFRCSNYSFHAILSAIVEKSPIPEPEKYIQMAVELRKYFDTLLGKNSIIIAPSFPTVAPYHNQTIFLHTFDFIYFGLFNVLLLPVTQCPMGLCPRTGLPLGIQLAANHKCDHLTIRLAEYFEDHLARWVPP